MDFTFKKNVSDGCLERRVHIVASPYKTGSSSVGEALKILGMGKRVMRHRGSVLRSLSPFLGPLNLKADEFSEFHKFKEAHGEKVKSDLSKLLHSVKPYDIFPDAPFGHSHLHPFICRVLAPKSCFIWVNRDLEDWLSSVQRWEESHPALYADKSSWRVDPDGRKAKLTRIWNKKLKRFRQLRREFPQDCLELHWGDLENFDSLARFYETPLPCVPFPRLNIDQSEKSNGRLFPRIVSVGRAIADQVPMFENTLLRIHSLMRRKN